MIRLEMILLVSGLMLFASGCSNSDTESLTAYGKEHRVELYSGGSKVREWHSTGKVLSEENGNGFYFKDVDSGQLIHVMGNVIVTPLTKGEARAGKKQQGTDPSWGVPPSVDAGHVIQGVPNQFDTLEPKKSL